MIGGIGLAVLAILSVQYVPKPVDFCPGFLAPRVYVAVGIAGDNGFGVFNVSSYGSAYYQDCFGNRVPHNIFGVHTILAENGTFGTQRTNEGFNTPAGNWNGFINTIGVPSWCYYGFISGAASDVDTQEMQSGELCVPLVCRLSTSIIGQGTING